jgi:Tfp pilus assembly protein PilF
VSYGVDDSDRFVHERLVAVFFFLSFFLSFHRRCFFLPLLMSSFRASINRLKLGACLIHSLSHPMQLTPTEPRFWNALGVLLEVRGTYDEAEFAYRRALKLDTHFGPAHNNLGNLLQRKRLSQQRQSRDIVQEYRLAIEAEPSSPVPHHNFANFLVSRNRIDESLREFVKAVELAQQSNATFRARLFNDYGLALKRLNQLPKAMEQFQNAGKDKREREREREREKREERRERERGKIER